MKFITGLPATLIYHTDKFHGRIQHHVFGTTDFNGILEVPDDDKFIDYLKSKFSPVEDEKVNLSKTTGAEIKLSTTPNGEHIEGDKKNDSTKCGRQGSHSKRKNTTRSATHSNSTKRR